MLSIRPLRRRWGGVLSSRSPRCLSELRARPFRTLLLFRDPAVSGPCQYTLGSVGRTRVDGPDLPAGNDRRLSSVGATGTILSPRAAGYLRRVTPSARHVVRAGLVAQWIDQDPMVAPTAATRSAGPEVAQRRPICRAVIPAGIATMSTAAPKTTSRVWIIRIGDSAVRTAVVATARRPPVSEVRVMSDDHGSSAPAESVVATCSIGSRAPWSRRKGGYSSRISAAYAHTRYSHRLMPMTKSNSDRG